jgi:hypothetical protein
MGVVFDIAHAVAFGVVRTPPELPTRARAFAGATQAHGFTALRTDGCVLRFGPGCRPETGQTLLETAVRKEAFALGV